MHYSGVWDFEAIRRHPEWAVINRLDGRLAINLVNTSGPHQTEPILDSIAPVGPLEITLRTSTKPVKITMQPEGRPLPFEYRGGIARTTVPRLDVDSILVVE